MTKTEIAALTMADVVAAKAAKEKARETRDGLDTQDYILCAVGETSLRSGRTTTLEMAKAELRRIYKV